MVRADAPGKIILFGEHAVVYGQPAIAAPLHAVRATAVAEPALPVSGLTVHAPDIDRTLRLEALDGGPDEPLHNALVFPIQVALRYLGLPIPDLRMTVRSTIPIASGLGSGAALATALVRALCAALGHSLTNDELNPLIFRVEQRHHGTPSGIDNTVIVYEQPVYFVSGTGPQPFTIARPFTLLVADTGHGSFTHETVGDVRRLHEAAPAQVAAIFAEIGGIARQARALIEAGEFTPLGPLMDSNHDLLRQLTVSSDTLDRLCAAARAAGAWGAKLSGGGRGGNIIALVDDERAGPVAEALRAAGAVNVIQTVVRAPEQALPCSPSR